LIVINPLLALMVGSRLLIQEQTGLLAVPGWLARQDLLFTERIGHDPETE
jgi:hypothetical protein